MKTLMIQGTGSSVGKSVIVAGLCRIFYELGYKVTPFKAQNMALNSFITRDGKEMGRAQVVQAEASCIEPSADMNPILIKPNSDTGAQVIIHGKVYGNMSAAKYHDFKKEAKKFVVESFNRLSEKFDIMIIEGAGSPAEINLMENDIVNMGMAEIADAPVILVGDIDKGGVFASLVGTLSLLPDKDKERIKAFLINKFRGDKSLLQPGLYEIETLTSVPFLGVIPYLKDVYIQEEDGVAIDSYLKKDLTLNEIKVAIVHLPHISNFTDFDALEKEPDVALKYINIGDNLDEFDIVIIPGSKNTIDDLCKIYSTGFHKQLKRFSGFIIGICGGFQMLGQKIFDPLHVESNKEEIEGLKFLNFTTVIEKDKITKQVKVKMNKSIKEFFTQDTLKGYEIHMGKNTYFDDNYLFENIEDSGKDGLCSSDKKIWGSYIHGIFDNNTFRRNFLNYVRKVKGLNPLSESSFVDYSKYKEEGFKKLAQIIKDNIDMKMLLKILNID